MATERFGLRCNRGPAAGKWWTGGGWGPKEERAAYASADEAREEADKRLDPGIVADVVRLGRPAADPGFAADVMAHGGDEARDLLRRLGLGR